MTLEDYETLPTNNVRVHMTAGALAGIMEHTIMYPLDSVKTRMQALIPGNTGTGSNVITVLSKMMQQEGLLRPLRGIGVMVFSAGPAHAMYFSCYEFLKNTMLNHWRTPPHMNHIVYGAAGCAATLLHDGVMNPADVVKQRLQMYNSPYRNVISCIRQIYRTEGIRAFYRSYTTQLAMNVPFQSIHFISYEFGQSIMNPNHEYNAATHVISGALAGAVAAAVTTPLDVCKTLLNTQQGGVKTQGMLDAIYMVYRLGGPTGYFRGMTARIVHQMPATGLCWFTYESFKYILHKPSGLPETTLSNNSSAAESSSSSSSGGGITSNTMSQNLQSIVPSLQSAKFVFANESSPLLK